MEERTNGLSIAGFVVSLASLAISLFCMVPIVGIALSAVGRSRAVAENSKTGLGTAGIVIGVISLVFNMIGLAAGM